MVHAKHTWRPGYAGQASSGWANSCMASHKTLASVVTSFAQSFTSLMNWRGDDFIMGHVVRAAWSTGATQLRVDLLSGGTDPSPLLVPDVRHSVARYVELFPEMVRRAKSSMEFVSKAELLVTVDPTIRRPSGYAGLLESPFLCTVRIVDDRGKVYVHEIKDWWFPEGGRPAQKKRWWRLW